MDDNGISPVKKIENIDDINEYLNKKLYEK